MARERKDPQMNRRPTLQAFAATLFTLTALNALANQPDPPRRSRDENRASHRDESKTTYDSESANRDASETRSSRDMRASERVDNPDPKHWETEPVRWPACLNAKTPCLEMQVSVCRFRETVTEVECSTDSTCKAICGDPRCEGGTNHGQLCEGPTHCPQGECRLRCVGGTYDGQFCMSDRACNDDGVCRLLSPPDPEYAVCFGGTNAFAPCTVDQECPDGTCSNRFCDGGFRNGQSCDNERDCIESICLLSPGCNDFDCCTAVCDREFDRYESSLCCEFAWSYYCAQTALFNCNVHPDP